MIWHYVAAGALLGGFIGGWAVRDWRCDAALLKAQKAAEAQFRKELEHRNKQGAAYETSRASSSQASHARQSEIRTIYRDRVVDGGCAVPDDARRVLEAAIADANAAATGQPRGTVPGTP